MELIRTHSQKNYLNVLAFILGFVAILCYVGMPRVRLVGNGHVVGMLDGLPEMAVRLLVYAVTFAPAAISLGIAGLLAVQRIDGRRKVTFLGIAGALFALAVFVMAALNEPTRWPSFSGW